jgi:LmbE family N-acetylglucosaminyl deacetylase
VTEWENLGYRDSDMMGRAGNLDARSFWQSNPDEAARRLAWLVRTYRPDVMTAYNDFGGYGHPDHIRTHDVAVAAFARAGDATWYPEQLAPEHGGTGAAEADGGLAPWAPAKLYEQAIPESVRRELTRRMDELGVPSFWSAPEGATPEQLEEHEAWLAKMLVPDDQVTTRVDIDAQLAAKWSAIKAHRSQISDDNPFVRFGMDAWREFWRYESYVLRESHVPATAPEDDLFAGLENREPGPYGWAPEPAQSAGTGAP